MNTAVAEQEKPKASNAEVMQVVATLHQTSKIKGGFKELGKSFDKMHGTMQNLEKNSAAQLAAQRYMAEGIQAINQNMLSALDEMAETKRFTKELVDLQRQSADTQNKQLEQQIIANMRNATVDLKYAQKDQRQLFIEELRSAVFDLHEAHNSYKEKNSGYTDFEFGILSQKHLEVLEKIGHREFTEIQDKKFLSDTVKQIRRNLEDCEKSMSKQDLEDRAFIETVDDIDEDQQLTEAFLKISSITERISDIEKEVSEFESMKESEASLVDKVKQAEELLKLIKSNVTSDKK
jgi:hypothetical protein